MSAVQYIKPKQSLTAKVGRMPTFDPGALARAEAALNTLSGQFDEWMQTEVDKLVAARDDAKAANWSEDAYAGVFTRAHDIKGLGSTYKYEIASQLANSLCRTLEARAFNPTPVITRLVTAHVEAIRACVRDGVRDASHPVAAALLKELSTQVGELAKA